jgi:hypothetical protein
MRNIATLLKEHVALKHECLDCLIVGGYLAKLQGPGARLVPEQAVLRGDPPPRRPRARDFVATLERLAAEKAMDRGGPPRARPPLRLSLITPWLPEAGNGDALVVGWVPRLTRGPVVQGCSGRAGTAAAMWQDPRQRAW